jgi:hypothetical protein
MSHYTMMVRIPWKILINHHDDIKASLAEMLTPYEESPEPGSPYLQFLDKTDEYRKRYSEETTEQVQLPDGSWVFSWDVRVTESEGDSFCSRRKLKSNMVKVERRFTEVYPTFEQFMKDYADLTQHEGQWGYWRNPNARWDWWQLGGRWTGFFPVVDVAKRRVGTPGLMMTEQAQGNTSDAVRLSEIDWEQAALTQQTDFAKFVQGYKSYLEREDSEPFGIRSTLLRRGILQVEKCRVEATSKTRCYYWDQNQKVKPEDTRKDWTDVVQLLTDEELEQFRVTFHPLQTFATLTEDGWKEPGTMGWFGYSSDTPESYLQWCRDFHERMFNGNPHDLLAVVDCHI